MTHTQTWAATHKTLVGTKCIRNSSTSALARPMAVGNLYQRPGYPSHSMTGGHDSVMSSYLFHLPCSCHKSDETFSSLPPVDIKWVLWFKCPFVSGWTRLSTHTSQPLIEAKCNYSTLALDRSMAVSNVPSHGMTGGHNSETRKGLAAMYFLYKRFPIATIRVLLV